MLFLYSDKIPEKRMSQIAKIVTDSQFCSLRYIWFRLIALSWWHSASEQVLVLGSYHPMAYSKQTENGGLVLDFFLQNVARLPDFPLENPTYLRVPLFPNNLRSCQ